MKKLLLIGLMLCVGSLSYAAKFIPANSGVHTVSGNVVTITLSDESGWSVQNFGTANLYINTAGATPAILGTNGSILILSTGLVYIPEVSTTLKMISDGEVQASVRVYR